MTAEKLRLIRYLLNQGSLTSAKRIYKGYKALGGSLKFRDLKRKYYKKGG